MIKTRCYVDFVAILLSLLCLPESAECTENSRGAEAIQLGASVQGLASTRQVCTRDVDDVSCYSFFTLLGFQAEAHYRLPHKWLAVGLLGGNGWHLDQAIDISSEGEVGVTRTIIWRLAMEGRGYILSRKRYALWCGLELGFARAVHIYEQTPGEVTRIKETAPNIGIGVGLDIRIVREFYIGAELRFLYWGFEEPPATPEGGRPVPKDLGHAVWPSFGVKFSYRFPLKQEAR